MGDPALFSAPWWSPLRSSLLGLFFPGGCLGCGAEPVDGQTGAFFCASCREALRQNYADACQYCAMPHATAAGRCVECQHCQHRFGAAVAIGRYEGMLRRLVLRSKHGADDALVIALADLMVEIWQARSDRPTITGVVAVPMPLRRRIFRAANLAEVLAERVASRLGAGLVPGGLRLKRNIKQQHNLKPAQRRRNLRSAMLASATYDYAGADLLVVDDVMTTGSTADEAARALLTAGAASVSVAVVARGVGLD